MDCPHCAKEIPETAVRCRHCRKAVIRTEKSRFFKGAGSFIKRIFLTDKAALKSPWSFLDIILLSLLIFLFAFRDPLQISRRLIDYLRLSSFIFVKEPKLLYYLAVYINSIVLNAACLILIIIFVKIRKASFANSILFTGRIPSSWTRWLPLYVGFCALARFINASNPLVPNIPLDSVFREAFIAGNAVIIFSVLFVAPFAEEILFRGFIYPAFNRYMGIHPSVFLTSVLFTLAHYPHIKEEFLFMASIFAFSAIATYAKAKSGSTWLAIIVHHVYNLVYVAIGFITYAVVRY